MTKTSTDYWYQYILTNYTQQEKILIKKIENTMLQELPSLLSIVFERQCILNCRHCFYPHISKSSQDISKKQNLEPAILNLVSQMPSKSIIGESPQFLHSGRVLKNWHIDTMLKVQKIRPDISLGIIDNGSFVNHLKKIKKENLLLDWIDISIDGDEKSHNNQRPSKNIADPFSMAINGLKKARQIIKPNGYVASLFTLTNLNYSDIEKVADNILENNLADLLAITTITPVLKNQELIEASPDYQNDNSHFETAWQQIKNATKKYGNDKIIFHLYRDVELEKIALAVGKEKFLKSFKKSKMNLHFISFKLDGVEINYSPISAWPKEEMIIDADAVIRVAMSGQYSLEEYQKGISKNGKDISSYSVIKANENTNYKKAYQETVKKYWKNFGIDFLKKEKEVIKRIQRG